MPTIKEILEEERNRKGGEVILFLEGKFWKAYERSAFIMTMLYNFKPTKRFVKLVAEDVISVGFPQEQLVKYAPGCIVESDGKRCRARFNLVPDELPFCEWKSSTRIRSPRPKEPVFFEIPEEWKPKTQVFREENLPVFKMVYDLLLRLFHESQKMGKDYRYTLGQDMKKYLLRTEVCVYHANREKDKARKVAFINEALELMLNVKLTVRILHDSKVLSLKKYALLCEQMVEVEKNLNDWKKYNLHDITQ